MKLLEVTRNRAFWHLDNFKGKKVRTAYLDIKKIDKMDSDNKYISDYQKKAWEELKQHACSTTKFYEKYKNSSFEQFPVITKNDLKNNLQNFMSDVYDREELFQMSTSGSTGTPFVCYQDERKKRRVNAEIIYYSEKAGYKLGRNLSYIRTIVKQNKKSNFRQFLQNQTLIHCEKLNDEGIETILKQLEKMSKKGPVTLLAYASTYTAIKDYAERNQCKKFDNCNMRGIISGSEMLYDSTREAMKRLFGTRVVSRYSNEENGVLGQDEGRNNIFPINEADYLIEIVDDNDNPVSDGQLGRIVVTDLYNYAMPLIRYDTGDMGAITVLNINGRDKRVISNFSGRRVDVIFDVDGNALSPFLITNKMWSFTDIKQFQFVQKSKNEYHIKLNANINIQRKNELVELMKEILGQEARLTVENVDEIPVLASGKRRYIVNEWRS